MTDSPKSSPKVLSKKHSSLTPKNVSVCVNVNLFLIYKDLIDNHDKLVEVFRSISSEEFPELLYKLFEAHNKTKELFGCAINHELALVSTVDEFKLPPTSVFYRLMLILIHNDFGRKFILLGLDPLVKKCVQYASLTDEVTKKISFSQFFRESMKTSLFRKLRSSFCTICTQT
jgi:hypothetical protein